MNLNEEITKLVSRLDRAEMLLAEARRVLNDVAADAGNVDEWNEGGEYYETSRAIGEFLYKKED